MNEFPNFKVERSLTPSRTHTLKTWPSAFEAQKAGVKTFEFRKNDRDFAVGDLLVLRWYDPSVPEYKQHLNPPELTRLVTYIVHGGQFGVPVGYCAMSTVPA